LKRYVIVLFILGAFLAGFGLGGLSRKPDPEIEDLLRRSMVVTRRCIVLTDLCLDRLDASRKVECR
jgi:hypothetical protein